MIRALGIGCVLLLAGCASPVVTRIDTAAPAPLPTPSSFSLMPAPGELSPVHYGATNRVSVELIDRGWRQADVGDYLLSVTLSDRPASARLQAGDDSGQPQAVIGPAPDRKKTRGCARRDHRLSVVLIQRQTGEIVYSGSGAEYHCKGTPSASMPHLVSAALEGLDGEPGPRMVERKGVR